MTSPCRTRSQNANKHPGKVQLDADAAARQEQNPGKKHTKKAAKIEGPKESPALKAARILQGAQEVAELEARMEVQERQALEVKPKPVRPKPRPTGKGKQKQTVSDVELAIEDQNDEELAEEDDETQLDDPPRKKKTAQKPSKVFMREAVKNARANMDAAIVLTSMRGSALNETQGQSTDFDARVANKKGNTGLTTAKKFSIAEETAQMVNWVNNVHPSKPRSGTHTSTTLSPAQFPPMTISGHSQTSRATTASVSARQASHGHDKNPDVPSDILHGGFSDEDEDDSTEHAAAMRVVEIVEDSQSDSDHEVSDIRTSKPIPQAPRVVSTSVKRKVEEMSIPETEGEDSEVEIIGDEDDLMDVDIPEAQVKAPPTAKKERGHRTTSSTSVGVVKPALPLPKKVKTEQDDSTGIPSGSQATTSTVRKVPRTKFRNQDLPVATSDARWLQDYMNTVILWAGSQHGWDIPKPSLVNAIQIIFDAVFPEIEYEVTTDGALFKVTSQRLSEWRSNIGSTALALMINFCSHARDDTPEGSPKLECKQIARNFLKDIKFIYQDPNNRSKETAYYSVFVLQIIASTHLSAISAYVDIPELQTKELALGDGMGQGVILLGVIALERALTFIRDEVINVQELLHQIATGSKLDIKLPKVLNPGTGKDTNKPYQFNEQNWPSQTRSYLISLTSRNRSQIRAIVAAAAELLAKSTTSSLSSTDDTEMAEDVRALACNARFKIK
ncbi:hypothetical protein BJ138DRAFT_1106444 [Hygrophoropsis aurantiaca]|uniref:Uncharacterized protein n=1 Tax=Hygrophoropsis aurantiaca TaxID=72124 RepID=A0ACB7ZX20_9AGAM|nr:hypothetical protein BJ138DRAFT_1106444 [Hygrophoropsis aurantiaca]